MTFATDLTSSAAFIVRQRKELAELFGFESRNKYEILRNDGQPIAFAAEQQKGFLGFLMRQFLGHWRTFDIQFFAPDRRALMVARHPFRFFFQRLEISDANGRPLGSLQQRWGFIARRFDVEDATGRVVMSTRAPIWSPWTFPFKLGGGGGQGSDVAVVRKKWSGLLKEMVTDADNFMVEVPAANMPAETRALLLAAAIFIDLQYFEKKTGR